MPDATVKDSKADQPKVVAEPAPMPEEVDEAQLAAVVGGVLRRGGDDDLDDLEVER